MTDLFEDAPAHSTRSCSRIPDSESSQTYRSSITMAPTVSAAAAAEKRLQDIHEQEMEDRKQERAHKAALNQATLEALAASTAQAKLATEEIHQARLAAIEKNPTIINATEVDSGESSLPPTAKSLDLLLPGIPASEVAAIWKGTFIPENLAKLRNDPSRIDSNRMELTVDGRVIASTKGSRKDFTSAAIWLEGFTNYGIIVQTLWVTPPPLAIAMTQFHQAIMSFSAQFVWNSVLNLAMTAHQRAMRLGQTDPTNWAIPIELQAANCNFATLRPAPLPSHNNSSSKRPRADTSTSSLAGQVCSNWNTGRPCFKSPCSFQHLCKACGGNHAKKDCKESP
jgi:hypothetical protein